MIRKEQGDEESEIREVAMSTALTRARKREIAWLGEIKNLKEELRNAKDEILVLKNSKKQDTGGEREDYQKNEKIKNSKKTKRNENYQAYKLKSAVCSEMAVVNIFSYNRNVMLFFV